MVAVPDARQVDHHGLARLQHAAGRERVRRVRLRAEQDRLRDRRCSRRRPGPARATISPYTSSSVTPGASASRAARMPASAITAASRIAARSSGDFTQRSSRTTSVPSTIVAPLLGGEGLEAGRERPVGPVRPQLEAERAVQPAERGELVDDELGAAAEARAREVAGVGRGREDAAERRLALGVEQDVAVVVDVHRDAAGGRPLARRLGLVPLALVAADPGHRLGRGEEQAVDPVAPPGARERAAGAPRTRPAGRPARGRRRSRNRPRRGSPCGCEHSGSGPPRGLAKVPARPCDAINCRQRRVRPTRIRSPSDGLSSVPNPPASTPAQRRPV